MFGTQALVEQVSEGEQLLARLQSATLVSSSEAEVEQWRNTTVKVLERQFSDHRLASSFWLKSSDIGQQAWPANKKENLIRPLEQGIAFLHGLIADSERGLYSPLDEEEIHKTTAIPLIRRLLRNFHKYVEAMYQSDVHGSGSIKKEDLDRIRIGNEYDVQRMLYALMRPIFPEARMEVAEDAGYRSVRYDIFLDQYDVVVEVKCTRKNMKERDLTEELGADAFHYPSRTVFFFVYDKEKIITNVDAFQKAYRRAESQFGKDVEAIVIQPLVL